ncbi:MAG: pyridoxal phosphate-dependent aminotransferase [Gammaproteobacteria bacterium]|nr:pyridoxal phosphate-dependent aminotransferase [Gammaproteobacteria bacterium]NNJ49655.1 pyridoxal phosphate-dependent aminotransferase [Gammaproteobacteria bacterium]
MKISLSDRIQRVKPSPTLAVSALAGQLRAEGRDIIGLATGEPDFDTPDSIKQAAIDAINKGYTKYTAVDGTASLKQAIINKFKRENDFDFNDDQILVSVGGKQAFYNLCQTLLDEGDEVIIPAPYWVSYPDIVKLADATPVIVEGDISQSFKITPEQLKQAITDRTKLFVINSPSNPSGKAYSRAELKALAEVLLQHPDIVVMTDDIYEHIIWTDEGFVNILNACPELYERTVVINGVSKAYSMTGWRIGYSGGPADIIKGMKKNQSQSTSNPCSIAQYAAEAALEGDQSFLQEMCDAFKQRHDFVYQTLDAMDGVKCPASDGTFYSFPSFQGVIERTPGVDDDVQLAQLILEKAEVALVPGSAFGLSGHLRLSYATDMESLEKALTRIRQFIE